LLYTFWFKYDSYNGQLVHGRMFGIFNVGLIFFAVANNVFVILQSPRWGVYAIKILVLKFD